MNKYQCVLSNTLSNNDYIKNQSNSKSTPEVFTENVEMMDISIEPEPVKKNINEKIIVSDDDDDEDDDDDDDEDDDDDDEDEDDDDEDDDEDDEDEDEDKDDDDIKELPIQSIKIVNIEVIDKINIENIIDEELEKETNDEIISNDLEENVIELIDSEDTMIKVEKIEINMDNDNVSVSTKENLKEIYNKMSVQELRKVVITKGLCSDSSKLKKNDLLKMLESPFI